ncbi:MAG: Nucleotidyl transferase, partial [Clostridiales bacterium]|nr:Nucleotidyl transferase [Clostridiales bacterium]
TRLYPYTKILPKPLIPIGDIPIVEHIINKFQNYKCDEYFLLLNYKKNMIKSYINDIEKTYKVEFVDELIPLGTGGGLSLLKGKVDKTFFLTNCDILVDEDYESIFKHHKEQGNIITMVCAFKHTTIPYGVIELNEFGDIDKITEKPEYTFLTNTGLYLVEPCVIDELEENTAIGFPDIFEKYRKNGQKVGIYPVNENAWMDMGQFEELEEMRKRLGV